MRPLSLPARFGAAFALALACIAGPAGVAAAATSGESDTTIEAFARADGTPQVRLRGTWPTPCMPSIESAALTDRDIRIALRSNKPLCARIPMPFDIAVDPVTQFGRTLAPGVYRISLYSAHTPNAAQELRDFELVEVGSPPVVRAESGFWWPDPSREGGAGATGTGASFEMHGDTLAVALFGFDGLGEQTWYFGTGALRARSAKLELVGLHGGPPLVDDAKAAGLAADANLTLRVEFENNARATVWLGRYERGEDQPKLKLRALSLVRQPLTSYSGSRNWEGEWVLLRENAARAPMAERIRLVSQIMPDFQVYVLSGDG
ncbi:MAG TPA: hypothetical protein VM555_10870, partial [Tahibacter sp.]|nr:hypothetical protein [Tahibacter sp.]